MEWARDGLGEPNEVRQATGEYRQEQDVLAAFLTEQCSFNPGFKVRSSSLYGAYLKWCERTGEYYLNQRRFGAAMTERTFKRDHSNGTWYVGIALNEDPL